MNKKYIILCCVLFVGVCTAQNLVPNYSFEIYTSCPTAQAQLSLAFPWNMPSNVAGTSDFYHACNTSSQGVPSNVLGYQPAKTGIGYAGVYTYGFDCREYLQVQLTSPMMPGIDYKLEMYVSPSENAGYAVDAFGIYVSTGPISGNGTFEPLPYLPQVSNPAGVLMTDTAAWILISGTYTATGGEDYITIGNFNWDATTQFQIFNSTGWGRGYYMVDDVSVAVDSTTSINYNINSLNTTSVFPSRFHDELNVYSGSSETCEFALYDLASRKILSQPLQHGNQKLQTANLSNEIYFYEIRNHAKVIKKGKVVRQ